MNTTQELLRRTRLVVSVLTLLGAVAWVSASPEPVSAFAKCEFANTGGMGPCDPDRGYMWSGECYDDDGCYYEDEECCAIIE